MNLYGNYIEESTTLVHIVTEEEILQEGVGIDLYNRFRDIKKYYKEQKYNLEESLNEGNVKDAKKTIKETIDYLMKQGKEIKEIDDTEFSSRIGIFGIQCMSFLANSLGDILIAGGGDAVMNTINGAIIKNKDKNATLGKAAAALSKIGVDKALNAAGIAKSAIFTMIKALAIPLYKEIMKQIETHERIEFKINREIRKNHKTEEEARKAVGGLYKNEILDYISDIIYDLKKLDGGLKVV